MNVPNAISEEWLRLGLAQMHLRTAMTVFASPQEAEPWAAALTQFGPSADSLRTVLSAGLGPAEFVTWRAVGVDSWKIAAWSKALSQAGLSDLHLRQWRSAGHKSAELLPLVTYLTERVSFIQLLDALKNWNAADLLRVLQAGPDVSRVVEMIQSGVTGPQLGEWSSANVPVDDWEDWIAIDAASRVAEMFHARGIDPAGAQLWLSRGLSPKEAAAAIDLGLSVDSVEPWIAAGLPASEAVGFIGAGAELDVAQRWIEAQIAAADAVEFIGGGVSLAVAQEWTSSTELTSDEIVEFIRMEVSLDQAVNFESRGIHSGQVTRTEAGLELDLDPWQEDPADQLPKVIEPGGFNITLWTTALGGDPVAHDVHFQWDGGHVADWYEDISIRNGLSFASSSPTAGVLAWPNGDDVLLTYRWNEMGLKGHDRLSGVAPTAGGLASDPAQWLRLADALVNFVLLDLGARSPENRAEYSNAKTGAEVDLDEIFRDYLFVDESSRDTGFASWLERQIAAGRYEVDSDEDAE